MQNAEDKQVIQPTKGAVTIVLSLLLGTQALIFAGAGSADEAWFRLPDPDTSAWSSKRLSRQAELDYDGLGDPIAVIRVPDLAVAAQVYPDTHKHALEAGAAWVSATTRPGGGGNIAIAGHRDSFFRPLEGIPLGTRISLTTPGDELLFAVTNVEIVDPLDTSSLAPTSTTTLTLITCHPFRYHGYAPDRYIIRAELVDKSLAHAEQVESALRMTTATEPKGDTL